MPDTTWRQRRYHLLWAIRFSLASLACFAASLFAWPTKAGAIIAAVGFVCSLLSTREIRAEKALL